MKATSIIKEQDIHDFIRRCQIKEAEGFECVKGIHQTSNGVFKSFRERRGMFEYMDETEDFYYCAVYQKEGKYAN